MLRQHDGIAKVRMPFILDEGARAALSRGMSVERVVPDRLLLREGDDCSHLLVVLEGMLRLFKAGSEGRRQVVAFRSDGELVTQAIRDGRTTVSVESVTTTTLGKIPRALLAENNGGAAALRSCLLGAAAEEIAEAQELLFSIACRSSEEKMAWFLLKMQKKRSLLDSAPGDLSLPMRRRDIAEHLAMRPETISRVLAKLRSRRVVNIISRQRVRVLKPADLETLAAAAIERQDSRRLRIH